MVYFDLIDLHVFSDASETGFDNCIYVVAQDEQGGRRAVLLTAKAKVAPLKTQSFLGLYAAILGSNLTKSVSESRNQMNL